MAMPQTLRDARGYRSRYINALNAAIKAIAPIAGRGIRLRQTPQGLPSCPDYPRVGGEESSLPRGQRPMRGLPPRGRGRAR